MRTNRIVLTTFIVPLDYLVSHANFWVLMYTFRLISCSPSLPWSIQIRIGFFMITSFLIIVIAIFIIINIVKRIPFSKLDPSVNNLSSQPLCCGRLQFQYGPMMFTILGRIEIIIVIVVEGLTS